MAKKMVNGKLVSVTMSDGSHVSANIEPSEETMAKALKAVEQYDLVKIRSASVQKSKMIQFIVLSRRWVWRVSGS